MTPPRTHRLEIRRSIIIPCSIFRVAQWLRFWARSFYFQVLLMLALPFTTPSTHHQPLSCYKHKPATYHPVQKDVTHISQRKLPTPDMLAKPDIFLCQDERDGMALSAGSLCARGHQMIVFLDKDRAMRFYSISRLNKYCETGRG